MCATRMLDAVEGEVDLLNVLGGDAPCDALYAGGGGG